MGSVAGGNLRTWADFHSWASIWHFLFPLKERETSRSCKAESHRYGLGRETGITWTRTGETYKGHLAKAVFPGHLEQPSPLPPTANGHKDITSPCSLGRDLVQQHNTTTPAQPQYHQHFPQGAVGNMTCGSGEMGPPELVFMKQKFFCVIQHRKIQVFSTKLCIISECWTILKWKTREVKQRTN